MTPNSCDSKNIRIGRLLICVLWFCFVFFFHLALYNFRCLCFGLFLECFVGGKRAKGNFIILSF